MTVLFKVPPPIDGGETVTIEAKPYGAVDLRQGDRVFLWWSEAQQGNGLAGYGECRSVVDLGDRLRAEVSVTRLAPDGVGFGRDQLRPHRDQGGASPEATLSKSLYRHAPNKVVQLSAAEEAFLDGMFANVEAS